jgi:hypothetical protein
VIAFALFCFVSLGLDALARAKRAAAADAEKGGGGGAWKRPHVVSVAAGEDEYGDKHGGTEVGNEEDEDDDRSDTRPAYGARKYRAARPDDTPSHHGGVNAEVVGAIVERTRQRRITGVSFVCVCLCVCFSVSLSSLYYYLCPSCRCHAVHNKQEYSQICCFKAASKFFSFFCVEKKLQVGVRLIIHGRLVHHKASMHF